LLIVNNISIVVQELPSRATVWSIPNAHRRIIRDLRWSSDGKRFVSASADGNVIIWDLAAKANLPPFEHDSAVYHAELDANGSRLVTAGADKFARLWNVATHSLIPQPMAHENRVASARFDLDAKWVVTASDDGTVRLWDGRTGRPYSEPLRLPVRLGDARFTSDGRHVEVAFEDYSIRMFKIARPLCVWPPTTALPSLNPRMNSPLSRATRWNCGRALVERRFSSLMKAP
jgi:WD40 repeat protein